ncbi:MAG: aminotransferase class I/II-fold pyridoxal phosphate-dependent enzyme [Nitrososphaerales archaeon]
MNPEERLREIREQIADKTRIIVEEFCQRLILAKEVAALKTQLNLPIEDYQIEKKLTQQIRNICVKNNIDPKLGLKLLNILISTSISIQKAATNKPLITPTTIFEETRRLEEQGAKIIHLEVGEPDFGPPQRVIDATIKALKEGRTHYTSKYGIPELRRALANRLSERWHTSIAPYETIVTPGGRAALTLALSTILNQGDSAIIFEPAWPAYKNCVESLGCRARVVSTTMENDWQPEVSQIEDLIDETTKVILVNSPCNPTGKVLSRKVLKSIINIAAKHNITIVSDEAYTEFSYRNRYSLLQEDCRKIVLGTFSKAWGMTGFRLGYIIAPKEICDAISEIAGEFYTSVPEPIQVAGLTALECFNEVDKYVALMKRRLETVLTLLKPLPITFKEPDGAFYIFFKLKDPISGEEFVEQLLKKHHVALTPGSSFGRYQSFVRFSFCRPEEELREGVARMREFLL